MLKLNKISPRKGDMPLVLRVDMERLNSGNLRLVTG
jgi:hypothetical protein